MLHPGDRLTANEHRCLLHALQLVRKYLIDGEHKWDVATRVDEALRLFESTTEARKD